MQFSFEKMIDPYHQKWYYNIQKDFCSCTARLRTNYGLFAEYYLSFKKYFYNLDHTGIVTFWPQQRHKV